MSPDPHGVDDPEVRDGLQLVAGGTRYFENQLSRLADPEFTAASLLPNWSRSHVIAHVAYNARALGNLIEWATTGVEKPMYPSAGVRDQDIERGAALSPSALRSLVADTADELSSGWGAMPSEAWQAELRTANGQPFKAQTTLWMRAREVWIHAVDLDIGGDYTDFPPEMIDRLQADVLSAWRRRRHSEEIPNFVLRATDRTTVRAIGKEDDASAIVLTGTAAQLARWATGRGASGIHVDGSSEAPAPPRWL